MIRYSAKFLAYKRRGYADKGVSIRMRITLRSQKPIDIATGYIIPIEHWDATSQQCVNTPQASEVNATLALWLSTLNNVMARYELIEKRTPTRGEVKDLFNDLVGRATPLTRSLDAPLDLFPAFDKFVSTMGKRNTWTTSTYQKFAALRKHLEHYDHLLCFATLSERKLQGYVDYLLAQGMRNTTIAKNLAFLRWYLRWAAFEGYYEGHLHDTFKPKLRTPSDKEIIYLTRDELHRMETHTFTPMQRSLEQVRDVFLFCCYSGLRYSDVATLQRSDIKDDNICVVTHKTRDSLRIELNKHTRAILDKYAHLHGKALPVISNVKMNSRLKQLGMVVGIDAPTRIVYFHGTERVEYVVPKWQLLTTHVARRTFVVTALQLGIPAEVIMRWTGHSRYDAMKPYVAIVDELKQKAMERFDEL